MFTLNNLLVCPLSHVFTIKIFFPGESENYEDSQGSGEDRGEDAEMNCPLANLATSQKEPQPNNLLALLEKRMLPDNEGPEVHADISNLLSIFLTKGLDTETRKSTIEKYPILKGCTKLMPPELNAEIKPCVTTATLRQDAFLVKLQGQIAAALSALAIPLNTMYEATKENPSDADKVQLEKLGDPVKLIADVFFSLSSHRRYLIVPSLDDSVKDILETCPIDSQLFGENFTEKLKTSKEAKKFGASIKKKPPTPRAKPPSRTLPSFSSSTKQMASTSTGRSSSFLAQRRPPPKTRYKKEEERGPRKRYYRQ